MLRFPSGPAGKNFLWLLFSLVANFTWAQSETATVSGQVVDPSGLNITGAQVKLVDIDRDTNTIAKTNDSGFYSFPAVKPGRYRMEVSAMGFKIVNVTGVMVNVQDHLEQNVKLAVGSIAESVTVEGATPLVDTESATVSTVVDRNFAENLPLNGRSFQTLIELTPGVVLTESNDTTRDNSVSTGSARLPTTGRSMESAQIWASAQMVPRAMDIAERLVHLAHWVAQTAWSRSMPCRSFASKRQHSLPNSAGHPVGKFQSSHVPARIHFMARYSTI